jgi:Ser/Thr protein kinase RdoA (MazF antagonist)
VVAFGVDQIPAAVLTAYAIEHTTIEPIVAGWINRTYRAGDIVVQRLHPIFRAELNDDIDTITEHLEKRGMITPRLVRTIDGASCVVIDGHVWRALSFVDGQMRDTLDPETARSAGRLVARFHRALSDLDHTFAFTRPGAHDTPAHLAKLAGLIAREEENEITPLASALIARVLPDLTALPLRIIHGDLKITNLLFDDAGEARVILDLDTLAKSTIAIELGDAFRSWCNPAGEADPRATFDREIFAAAIEGYAQGADGMLTREEIAAIVPGIETIAIELASRFAADYYEDRYFGYDASKYPSRRAHNLARTKAQLQLADSIASQRTELDTIVARTFSR